MADEAADCVEKRRLPDTHSGVIPSISKRAGKSLTTAFGALTRRRLAVGRAISRVPEPIKELLRPIKIIVGRSKPIQLEGWDLPLINGASCSPLIWPVETFNDVVIQPAVRRTDLNCLLVTESLDAGGVDEFVAFLARRLPEERIKATILLVADARGWNDGRIASALRDEGVAVVSAAVSTGRDFIVDCAPDVVYSHGAAEWPLKVARDLGIPTLEALHGMHNAFNTTQRQLAGRRQLLDRVVAVSELVRQQYLALDAEASPSRVVTIANGIDRTRARTVDRRTARSALGLSNEFLFVSLARHAVQKNTYGLADAFLEVADRHQNAHLLVCGRPDDREYTDQVVGLRDRAPAGGRLHLRDHAHQVNVLLAAADVFVLNSFFEGWSLASMEALGLGVPVLLSDVGGAREQLSGSLSKGLLIGNPLGDPLRVDWRTSYNARFRPQSNRAQLIGALTAFTKGEVELASRSEIREHSLEHFCDDVCLKAHAEIVREVAQKMNAY